MGFFSKDKELKEENNKLRAELQAKSLMIEELKSKIPRYSLFNNPISKEKRAIINQRYYLKHKNKENQKKQKENHDYFKPKILLKNPFMTKEEYLEQQAKQKE